MGFDEATYLAAALISVEALIRFGWVTSNNSFNSAYYYSPFAIEASTVFVVFFAVSMLSTALFVWRCHKWSIFKNPTVQQFLPFLYMIDSLGALILGYNLYYENITGVVVAMTLLTNFFMLHILHGVFSGKGHNDMVKMNPLGGISSAHCTMTLTMYRYCFHRVKSSQPR